jgi:calcium-dependent protein kinase
MYGKDKEIRIVDFGLSKNSKEKMSTYAGTPYFMAPEVIQSNYSHKCDIWSLGCVLYMLVQGRLPFDGFSKPEVFGKIQRGEF